MNQEGLWEFWHKNSPDHRQVVRLRYARSGRLVAVHKDEAVVCRATAALTMEVYEWRRIEIPRMCPADA